MIDSREAYDRLLAGLFDRHPSVQTAGFSAGAYKPGLDAMRRFDAVLGHPSEQFRSIHVAGTNGKGSVCSMLAAALAGAGLRVGLYTSPHLTDFRERIKLVEAGGCSMIPRETVFRFLTEREAELEGLSFFEITTGLAFRWFADQQVDLAVIEVGLGGRLDSTNILTPELAIVTSIGLDHCALLGNSRAVIAAEKAGIFKPGVPALCGQRDSETQPVFEARAAAAPCPLFFAEDFPTEPLELDLTGPCQGENLRTVLAALELLGVDRDPAVRDAICHAAARTGLRGRWERVLDEPEVICDIGHNPPALEHNFRRLRESGRPLLIVYGIMADKDLVAIRKMMPPEARYFLVAPRGERALGVEALAAQMDGLDCTLCESVQDGVRQALTAAKEIPGCILYIGGSNFVVAEAIGMFDPKSDPL